MKNNWTEFKSGIRSFYLDTEIIHIIPTTNPHGNNDDYFIVVNDDPYFITSGNTKILSKNKIEELYNIEL
jgi:hypothetical protein